MKHDNLEHFLKSNGRELSSPIAVILAEDEIELQSTIDHHQDLGFESIIVLGEVGGLDADATHIIPMTLDRLEDSVAALNKIMKYIAGKWLYYCFNAEYLFFPYCENRSIKDALTFMEEERRTSVFTYSIDLYPQDLRTHQNGVDKDTAHLDRNGYYGMNRFDEELNETIERQVDIFGGLRWRFEEHIPWQKRRIDRISLFKVTHGLLIDDKLRLSEPEQNTVSCEWHNNMTMSVMSFRVAKALMHNPGSAEAIETFTWGGSEKFQWNSQQLLDMGFMEPGQWF